jgi:outer membrane protein
MTRMQAFVVSLSAALCLALALPAVAQTNLRIGFVNVNYLLQNAPQTQAVNQALQDEFAPREAQLVVQQQQHQTKVEDYQRDAAVMPESERAALERELQRVQLELQRSAAALQEDVEIRQEELVAELQATVARRVQAFAVAQGYDIIVTSVLYASDAVDITEEVFAAISAGAAPAATSGSEPSSAPTE